MKITLTHGYYITEDNYNYILKQEYIGTAKKDKKQKKMTRTVGYYSNGIKGLKSLLKRYLEDCPLNDEKLADGSLKTFCDHLERVVEDNSLYIVTNIADLICDDDEREKIVRCYNCYSFQKPDYCVYLGADTHPLSGCPYHNPNGMNPDELAKLIDECGGD